MDVTEVILLLTLLAAIFKLGYDIGKDIKNRH